MLKIMVLRKRHEKMLEEAEQLRSKISGFKSREADVAAQVKAASTDEEIAAAAAAVEELEKAQKSAKERLATIIEEAEALQQEIADAEAAASSAAGGDGGEDGGDEGEARSRRSMSPDFRRRCQDFPANRQAHLPECQVLRDPHRCAQLLHRRNWPHRCQRY